MLSCCVEVLWGFCDFSGLGHLKFQAAFDIHGSKKRTGRAKRRSWQSHGAKMGQCCQGMSRVSVCFSVSVMTKLVSVCISICQLPTMSNVFIQIFFNVFNFFSVALPREARHDIILRHTGQRPWEGGALFGGSHHFCFCQNAMVGFLSDIYIHVYII
jgi:hypothetical protein